MSPGAFLTLAGLGLVIVYMIDLGMMLHGYRPLDLKRFIVAQHQVSSGVFFIFGGFALDAGRALAIGVLLQWTAR